jgi:catechol 2,3-dioxygenase-like lactoylglutathione lyase family enzyme
MSLGAIKHLALTVAELERSVSFYNRILRFFGYRLSERQDDYVEWEGPCGWFILRPARAGSRDRPHDRYGPGLHHLAFSAESQEPVDSPVRGWTRCRFGYRNRAGAQSSTYCRALGRSRRGPAPASRR